MKFRVGPYQWRVLICDDLPGPDGEQLPGFAESSTRTIMLHATVPQHRRAELLRHELSEAWALDIGECWDQESQHNRTAAVAEQLERDLAEQGGWPEFLAMWRKHRATRMQPALVGVGSEPTYVPIEVDVPVAATGPASADHAACPRCGRIRGGSCIIAARPYWHHRAKGTVVDRAMHCGHCDILIRWTQGAMPDGSTLPGIVEGPTLHTGAALAVFLAKNPAARDME